jgi:hypothetical protein
LQNRILNLSPIIDLLPFLSRGELVSLNVNVDGSLCILIALRSLDYRFQDKTGASFAKTSPAQPQDYLLALFQGKELALEAKIRAERFNIHAVQTLPDDEILLVCARSLNQRDGDADKNGRVYSKQGVFLREMLLGDGIEDVQTTATGMIWTSYFDEGVFGNYGWAEPLGASGLVAWDKYGKILYKFDPPGGLDTICDCYALNVESDDDVWLYYYTDFPLVHIRAYKSSSFWQVPIRGSHSFAVSGRQVLFRGGYNDPDQYYLYEMGPAAALLPIATLEIRDEKDQRINATRAVGRGDAFWVLSGQRVYRFAVDDVLM